MRKSHKRKVSDRKFKRAMMRWVKKASRQLAEQIEKEVLQALFEGKLGM